jgi:superfamily II DNA or RNA helicase
MVSDSMDTDAMNDNHYDPGDRVSAPQFGVGVVEFDKGATVIVRFDHGLEECEKHGLERIATPLQALEEPTWHVPLEVITRVQAEAILSVNDAWGVLSRSRIALLPHQLWVCKRVLERWPARWLVADDVGLGKTIEAGLILWPVLSRKLVRRLLILCPAKLVEQWQHRLRTMFDIRLVQYSTEADTPGADFFGTHDQVVASFHTLALLVSDSERNAPKREKRLMRFFDSPPWDLLIVDEAHHFNYDEQAGPTLSFKLMQKMHERRLLSSMVFFTGTPHRGKNFGFLQLLSLLRPDLINPKAPLQEALPHLREVLIRNNKHNVTDLDGKRLFRKPETRVQSYRYSEAEQRFYDMLTDFIATGLAYASTIGGQEGRAVGLVLVSLQKLASSSVAAIRRAIRGRLERIHAARRELAVKTASLEALSRTLKEYEAAEQQTGENDELSWLEERVAELSTDLRLMENEEPRLEDLLASADKVRDETKISQLIQLVENEFDGRQVLFFTEYKATQSLVMSALIGRFGDDCVAFINGDNRADGVIDSTGKPKSVVGTREDAAANFNAGKCRFLISTEAGGEGIDLQERCHTLVHVDLPWNPMRLHQRVGRLNRYGQTERVEVTILRNPDTVEALIWEKLDGKTQQIMRSLSEVMDEPEDLLELVLGMTDSSLFRELFSQAACVPRESVSAWFDQQTAQFGGQDVLDTVRDLVGHCDKFDFRNASASIPRLDLPDLKPFFLAMLGQHKRRVHVDETGISFKTPDAWRADPAVRISYERMIFDRNDRSADATQRILGVGHKLIDSATEQARKCPAAVTLLDRDVLNDALIVFRVTDRVTVDSGTVRAAIFAVSHGKDNGDKILRDWELLKRLNELCESRGIKGAEAPVRPNKVSAISTAVAECQQALQSTLSSYDLPFRVPEIHPLAVLWPIDAR